MRPAVIIAVFTAFWLAVSGSFTIPNLLLGIAASALSLVLIRGRARSEGRRLRPLKVLSLLVLFIKELALSAWKVAILVASPKMALKPGIFAFPLTVDRDFEITLLANLITLTPGTLSVDVSEDRRVLYVHALDCSDPVATRRAIANGFEKKVMEAFR
ncbi:Na+/H+ antiporter subunit E [Shinella sp.]|uniref:Na+/H+ antiporter subunit E n=1 Tax=Shinella sp. TaxID=1870904 RepID=UPI003F6F7008